MSVKEVTELRKSGQLGQAFKLAMKDLREDPNDSWAQTAMFWVLRDICQHSIETGDSPMVSKSLSRMKELLNTMEDGNDIGRKTYERLSRNILPESDSIKKISDLSKTSPIQAFEALKNLQKSGLELHDNFHEDIGWIIYRFMKVQVDNVTSREIRYYLRDYINLHNPRPSMLHSMVLNFAINFSKDHSDFIFYNFFMLWGPENLRYEDFKSSHSQGIDYPPLISRIARIIVNTCPDFSLKKICEEISSRESDVLESFREVYFWKITKLHKEGKISEMLQCFKTYNTINSNCKSSHWDSEILRLAVIFLKDDKVSAFFDFMRNRNCANFSKEDWVEQKDTEGKSYPCLAVQAVRRCFEYYKTIPNKDPNDLQWMGDLYDIVISNSPKDEWICRQRAIVYIWQNQLDKAFIEYKKLLLDTSDKYYIWSEIASCVTNPILKIAFLCKALTMEKNQDFLGNIHLELAELLIQNKQNKEARIELNIYAKNHERLNSKYEELNNEIVNVKDTSLKNSSFYESHVQIAEDSVFSDCDSTIVTLVDKWEFEGKEKYEFTDGEKVSFVINGKRFSQIKNSTLGSSFSVYYTTKSPQNKNTCCGFEITPEVRYIPLSMHVADGALWEKLPLKYGYIEYVNTEKDILHILTENSKQLFQKSVEDYKFKKGDFLKFRSYSKTVQNEIRYFATNLVPCKQEEALEHFPARIVAVDDINNNKKLFHFTFGAGRIGGIVYFDHADFIPELGECLKMWTLITKDKAGNKKPLVFKTEKTSEKNANAVKTISGELRLHFPDWDNDHPDFAFVKDCYVHSSILHRYGISENCDVIADIVYSGNGKWKVVKIYPRT